MNDTTGKITSIGAKIEQLDTIPADVLEDSYTEVQMAAILGYKLSTMVKKRSQNDGTLPPWEKRGRKFYYPKDEYVLFCKRRQRGKNQRAS